MVGYFTTMGWLRHLQVLNALNRLYCVRIALNVRLMMFITTTGAMEKKFGKTTFVDTQRGESMNKLDDTIASVAYILDTLMAYRNIVETGCCNDCMCAKSCKYLPKLGQMVRYNCPFYERRTDE